VTLHPDEEQLQAARVLERTDCLRQQYRQRTAAEHRVAPSAQLGVRQTRIFGRSKRLFQAVHTRRKWAERVMHMKTLIVMPAYNEADTIGATISQVKRAVPDADVAVVDDGSSDNTAEVALKAGASVLPLPINLGYGGALQVGFMYAEANNYDEVVQIDADGQHEPACVADLLAELRTGKVDLVIGSRFLDGGDYRPTKARAMGMSLMRRLTRIATGKKITDPTSGFQAMNRKAICLYASDVYPSDYPDADVLIMIHRAGLRVREIPVKMYQRESGVSMHSGLKPIWYMFKMLLSITVTLLRKPPTLVRSG